MYNRRVIVRVLTILTFMLFNCFSMLAQETGFETKYPVELSENMGSRDELVIYLTGDGGWNKFSKNLANEIESQGFGVVSLNSYKYFRSQKSPEIFARDIAQISDYYLKKWNKKSVIIVGYSFGADVASFLPEYLSEPLKNKIQKVVLLSPSASTDFVVRLSDLMGFNDNENGKFLVRPEIEKSQLPMVCIFGKDESLLLKEHLESNDQVSVYKLPGHHNYNDNYDRLVKIILS